MTRPRDVSHHTLIAQVDPGLRAVLTQLAKLRYADGGAPSEDRPAHVRAASAIRRTGSRLVIVQDDVNVLALRHADGETSAVLLPVGEHGARAFDDDRGNKRAKMDLEACLVLPDGRLVAFGSGSSRRREQLVVLDEEAQVRVVDAADLYSYLRAEEAFAGSELNIEGALVIDERVRLFQRGNGAARGALLPVNAMGDFSLAAFLAWLDRQGPVPALLDVVQVDLGRIGTARFGFTDATLLADGRVAFLASAEDSPDTLRDGEVQGSRFGLIEEGAVRMTDIQEPSGQYGVLKLEGIEARLHDSSTFDVVADMDRAEEAALLGELHISGA